MIIMSSILMTNELRTSIKFSEYLSKTNQGYNTYDCYLDYIKKNNTMTYKVDLEDFNLRSDLPSPIDVLISIWVIGLIWQELRKLIVFGFRDYFQSWNSIVNIIQTVLYFTSYGLKYYTMFVVRQNKLKVSSFSYWNDYVILYHNNTEVQKDVFDTIYWLNNDRYFWLSSDPINMAEGLFAVANLFSFARICFLLPASQELGPLQISLGNMISVFILLNLDLNFHFC